MEHWPGHETRDKTHATDEADDRGKNRELRQDSSPSAWQWPHLEHGAIGRASLISKGGHLRWATAVDTSRNRWAPLGKPTKVFPETRSPPVNVREHSVRERSEKGLQYLRSYFPDVDVSGELLGGTLEADGNETRRLESFDPFVGNLLEILPSHIIQNGSIVVFPMGQLGRELNISALGSDESGHALFCPSGLPSFTFETPILQVSSSIASSEWLAAPFSRLLVRTHASVSLLHVVSERDGLRSRVTRELDITRSDTGDTPVVDSRILAAGPDILVVNRDGTVFKCNAYCGRKAMQLISTNENSDNDYFWQLGTTHRLDECFLTSRQGVKHIDFRSNTSADVFAPESSTAIVTSFESPLYDHIGRATTTSDIIWLDNRFRKQPLLSFKHHRSFDRTLRVLTGNLGGASWSLLTSQRNGLVTVYDVNRSSAGLLHCNSTPACLPCDDPPGLLYNGHGFLVGPSSTKLSLVRLCHRGSIRRQDIRLLRPDEDELAVDEQIHVSHRWNEDVQRLDRLARELQTDFGPAGGRHSTEVNLRGAYEKIFATANEDQNGGDGAALHDTLARLPNFWQENEASIENMLTTFDIVSHAEGANQISRADFLTSTSINSTQGFRALMCGNISFETHAGSASWHYDLQNTTIHPFHDRSSDWSALTERLKQLDLTLANETPDDSRMRRETEAREHLVLDLALSKDVYSTKPFTKPRTSPGTPDTITQANKVISSDELPEVEFGYFRPVCKIGAEHYMDRSQEGRGQVAPVSSPLGVRLLLAEWEVGADPQNYVYRDPYGVADLDTLPIPSYRSLLGGTGGLTPAREAQLPPQRPPPVATQSTQPPVIQTVQRPPMVAQSQTLKQTTSQRQVEPSLDVFSQEPMMSTQVLPGPFGGRPVTGGKKPVKKRMGGF